MPSEGNLTSHLDLAKTVKTSHLVKTAIALAFLFQIGLKTVNHLMEIAHIWLQLRIEFIEISESREILQLVQELHVFMLKSQKETHIVIGGRLHRISAK